VPQDPQGRFSTELFERYLRAEKALLAAMAEMFVQGVSAESEGDHRRAARAFLPASTISSVVKKLDDEFERYACRRLSEPLPYLILDARYEKVRVDSVIESQSVPIVISIDGEGRWQVLGGELAPRASRPSWREFLMESKNTGATVSSTWCPTTMMACARRWPSTWAGPPGSAVTWVVEKPRAA
jgi:putative transposase